MLGQANGVMWVLHHTHDGLRLQPRESKGTIADKANTSEATGLVAGLCIALISVLVFGLYLVRRRMSKLVSNNNNARPEAQRCCESSHDRLTMSETSHLDFTNKPPRASQYNSACTQDEGSHEIYQGPSPSVPVLPSAIFSAPGQRSSLRQESTIVKFTFPCPLSRSLTR